MGHALRRAVRVHAGNALHSPGDQSQPPVTSELITFIEEHLHAQADAQKRRAYSAFIGDGIRQRKTGEARHAVLERAHAGKHQRLRGQDAAAAAGNLHLRTEILKGTPHAEQIRKPVIDHCYLHFQRTSIPCSRMPALSCGTVVFL